MATIDDMFQEQLRRFLTNNASASHFYAQYIVKDVLSPPGVMPPEIKTEAKYIQMTRDGHITANDRSSINEYEFIGAYPGKNDIPLFGTMEYIARYS